MLGIITQVCGQATAVMSSYSAALGLDAPIEVVPRIHVACVVLSYV